MAAERLAGYRQKIAIPERPEFLHGDNGIILGDKDVYRYIQILKRFLAERIESEIIPIGRELGKVNHDVRRERHTRFGRQHFIEIVPLGKEPLLFLERTPPFLQKVFSIESLTVVNRQCRLIWIQSGAHGEHVL